MVDLLAVGLRRVPLAGLPLLAMYTAPISLLDGGVPWWKFILVAVVFLALLAGEESVRLGHWGRDLGADADEGAGWLLGANRTRLAVRSSDRAQRNGPGCGAAALHPDLRQRHPRRHRIG